MELIPFKGALKRQLTRRRGYNRLYTNRKNTNVVKFGSVKVKRSWKLRIAPKLRLAVRMAAPIKLWHMLKNAYMDMMLGLANRAGTLGGGKTFDTKRIPQGRDAFPKGSGPEFENRLVFEIYKSMMASYELGYTPPPSKVVNS